MGNCVRWQFRWRGCCSCMSQSWLSVSLYSTFRLLSQTNVANLIAEAWVYWLTQWLCKSWIQRQRTISFWGQQLLASQIALSKGKSYRLWRASKGVLARRPLSDGTMHPMADELQLVYRLLYSTETAPTKVFNDLPSQPVIIQVWKAVWVAYHRTWLVLDISGGLFVRVVLSDSSLCVCNQ